MIASLKGLLAYKETDRVIIDIHGVGYEVCIPLSTYYDLPAEGEEIFLYIAMIVREDSMTLYGFLSPDDKELFYMLLKVSKVGPKLAVNLLSGINGPELVSAIQRDDLVKIKSVPGVGLKTAERIILELKGKLPTDMIASDSDLPHPEKEQQRLFDDIVTALITLGYPKNQGEKAARKSFALSENNDTMEIVLKNALKLLSTKD